MKEWKRSHEQNASSYTGVQARLDKVLDVAIARESENLEKRLGFLATVGSASPFIGLFGTVWGIMNAFTAIAQSSSTNLAVVAGPIAEALFATALGLLAAIPAVIAYNKLSSDANKMVGAARGLCRRVLDHPQPPARSAGSPLMAMATAGGGRKARPAAGAAAATSR